MSPQSILFFFCNLICPKSFFERGFCLSSLFKLEGTLLLPSQESSWPICDGTGLSQRATIPRILCVAPDGWCVSPGRVLKKRQLSKITFFNSLSSKALNMSTKYLAVGYNHFVFASLRRVAEFSPVVNSLQGWGYQRVQLTLWHHFTIRHCSFSWVLLWILTQLEAVYKLSNNGGRGDRMGV